MPGSENLKNSAAVIKIIREMNNVNKLIGAICAAPIVLAAAGVLNGRSAVCYPGYEKELGGAKIANVPYVVDSNIITGKGAGIALTFSLKIVEILNSRETAEKLRSAMQIYWTDSF